MTATSSWTERFVEAIDGTRLYVRQNPGRLDGGEAVTAVLCDGIACDGFIWRFLERDLLPVAGLLHWNYRGHGRSRAPVDDSRVDIATFIDDLESVRACIEGGGSHVLIGHSMGCQIALEGYRRAPEDVGGLVLICGTAGRMTHTFKGGDALARALPGLIERVDKSPRWARALWGLVPPSVSAKAAVLLREVENVDVEDMEKYSAHVRDLNLPMFLRMLRTCGDETAEDMLDSVEVPVLVIAGSKDTFTPPHLAEAMAAKLPNSELMMVDGATHVVPIERREVVAERITAFIRDKVLLRYGEQT